MGFAGSERMRIDRRLLAVLLSVAAATSIPAQSADLRATMERGAAAMRAGRLEDAENDFREAVRLAPTVADAQLDFGLILAREGKIDEAIAALKQSLKLNPQMPSAHQFLGILLYNQHRVAESRQELLAELELDPKNVETLTFLANVELGEGHSVEAAEWLDRAYTLAPANMDVLELRGKAHDQIAHDSYARMAQLEPNNWHVHRVQAQIYAEQDRHREAIAEYEAAVKLETHNPDLYENLGDEYRNVSQLDLALAAYRKELALAPANPIAMYNVGSVQVELGASAEGVPLLFRAAEQMQGSSRAEYYLGRGLLTLNRDAEAASWLEKAAADDPGGEIGKRSYFELARADRKLHRTAAAEAATAGYNRIRESQEKAGKQDVQRFKEANSTTPASGGDSAPKP